MAVLASKFPTATPDLIAYMLTIMKMQREYEVPAWRLYDQAYRDKAAATGNRKWSQVDTHLYNQVFTGLARRTPICGHCGLSGHGGDVCPSTGFPSRKRITVTNSSIPAVAPPYIFPMVGKGLAGVVVAL